MTAFWGDNLLLECKKNECFRNVLDHCETPLDFVPDKSGKLLACVMEYFPTCVLHVATRSNIREQSPRGWDAIDIAGWFGRLDWIEVFLRIARIPAPDMDFPHLALFRNDTKIVAWWLEHGRNEQNLRDSWFGPNKHIPKRLLHSASLEMIGFLCTRPALRSTLVTGEMLTFLCGRDVLVAARLTSLFALLKPSSLELSDALLYVLEHCSYRGELRRLVDIGAKFMPASWISEASGVSQMVDFIHACVENIAEFNSPCNKRYPIFKPLHSGRKTKKRKAALVFAWPLGPRLRLLMAGQIQMSWEELNIVPRFFLLYVWEWVLAQALFLHLPKCLCNVVLCFADFIAEWSREDLALLFPHPQKIKT